ncbi:hypothetical protein VTN31DRAFT_3391 [Thermomyces dupontii]|uniref:uncharacterized protein n=1 Tax=Talaromyces thermophilus TaxID=28565 RepID=UPI003742C3F2
MTARPASFDSERPIMAPSINSDRASKRLSTLSGAPSLASSEHTTNSLPAGDPRMDQIRAYSEAIERLENKRLSQQRFVPTPEKADNWQKLALGAKVERALGRRMTSQDAVMRKPIGMNEKKSVKTES